MQLILNIQNNYIKTKQSTFSSEIYRPRPTSSLANKCLMEHTGLHMILEVILRAKRQLAMRALTAGVS